MFKYKFINLSDFNAAYIEEGQGEPLLLLHGNGENSEYFSAQIKEFSKFYHVYAIDSRGHGKSERGIKSLTLNQLADDLYEFITKLDINKAHVLGFSDGGNIALLFALKHQDKINKLILNAANLNTKGVKLHIQAGIELGYLSVIPFAKKSEKAKLKKEIMSLMIGQPNVSFNQLHNIQAPTLVIAGTKDMIKHSHTKKIAENIKNSKLVILNGTHFIAAENPNSFNKSVLDFLKF